MDAYFTETLEEFMGSSLVTWVSICLTFLLQRFKTNFIVIKQGLYIKRIYVYNWNVCTHHLFLMLTIIPVIIYTNDYALK